ncbi:hypothetical protein [Catenulispora pinisilvae]|uniref:hypothetical protein n=1 Tax=Catenulispora pinisilvae TaxID=2705253 RepID=UPI00189228AE|nr:hypothetical protein [Catenulispora pinisilvae]
MAALLSAQAFIEIRVLAGSNAATRDVSPTVRLERIRFLADLCHNLPGIVNPSKMRPVREGVVGSRNRAMAERPMIWTWHTSGPEGQAWILQKVQEAGYRWTPPPPFPEYRKGAPPLTVRQRVGALAGWPVRTPSGHSPLPRQARVLKAVDADTVHALGKGAGRLRLGLGHGSPWLQAHLDQSAEHFIYPDPAAYYWPAPKAGRPWWQCRVLQRMIDGEQICDSLAVMPQTFTALPPNVGRRRQRQLVQIARGTERDSYLWGRDHRDSCSPQTCGFAPDEAAGQSDITDSSD